MSGSKDNAGLDLLRRQAVLDRDFARLSDAQVAELLLDEVWGNLSSLDDKATIVSQAIDRLRRTGEGALNDKDG